MNRIKNKVGGRPPKIDPAKNRISVNFTDVEEADFLTLYEQSGMQSKASFIKARVFNECFKVIKVDGEAIKYTNQLSSFYNQFRAIGRNYNQIVLALKRNFDERTAMKLLYDLEQSTRDLIIITRQVISLSEEFRKEYGSKN